MRVKINGKSKRVLANFNVKLQGQVIDTIRAGRNARWTEDSSDYRYLLISDDDYTGTDDRDEVRQMIADMIREIRANAIDAQRDRDNDDLDEAIESIKDAGKARKALEILRAAGLID